MELTMAKGFSELSLSEVTNVNGGELYQDAEEANLAAFAFAVCSIVVGGPLSKIYGVLAAYSYLEASNGTYKEPAEPAPYVPGNGVSSGGRTHSGGSMRY